MEHDRRVIGRRDMDRLLWEEFKDLRKQVNRLTIWMTILITLAFGGKDALGFVIG